MDDSTRQALDSRPTDPKTGERINKFPSTGRIENGTWVPDPLNNVLAGQNTSAHSLGQLRHHGGQPKYCAQHSVLGCTSDDCN